ncbi:unnamed protein product [Schistosoma curassoni]|uniref:Transposase n=1 Tax=Schistosoma curassoni TaxID=6186 RepID=A0A183JPM8_9TREM|nr:unnamed protein product [Schistosoma curassoni]
MNNYNMISSEDFVPIQNHFHVHFDVRHDESQSRRNKDKKQN